MLDKLNALKESFYNHPDNLKKSLFKTKQKEDCALMVANQISLDEVISQSFFTLPGCPSVFYMNYPIMKTYMNHENYQEITDKLIQVLVGATQMSSTGQIQVHINLNGFTVSAAERYKYIVEYFSTKCNENDIVLTPFIECVNIYYTPAAMPSIMSMLRLFIQPKIFDIINYIAKDESAELLHTLFSQ